MPLKQGYMTKRATRAAKRRDVSPPSPSSEQDLSFGDVHDGDGDAPTGEKSIKDVLRQLDARADATVERAAMSMNVVAEDAEEAATDARDQAAGAIAHCKKVLLGPARSVVADLTARSESLLDVLKETIANTEREHAKDAAALKEELFNLADAVGLRAVSDVYSEGQRATLADESF